MRKLEGKEVKQNILEILCMFSDYCDKHELRYYLAGGTLLGAIRHKGFIPWDDDIDLLMPRSDFDRLHQLIQTDPMNDRYKLVGISAGNSDIPFAKIIDLRTEIESKYLEIDKNLWIDIFPIDGLPYSIEESDAHINSAMVVKGKYAKCMAKLGTGKNIFRAIAKIPAVLVCKMIGTKRLGKKLDEIGRKYSFEECEFVGDVSWSLGPKERMRKADFIPYEEVEFEGKMFHAPKCWNYYLTKLYGDYMIPPPEKNRETHSFVAFIKE